MPRKSPRISQYARRRLVGFLARERELEVESAVDSHRGSGDAAALRALERAGLLTSTACLYSLTGAGRIAAATFQAEGVKPEGRRP